MAQISQSCYAVSGDRYLFRGVLPTEDELAMVWRLSFPRIRDGFVGLEIIQVESKFANFAAKLGCGILSRPQLQNSNGFDIMI
jgi:hypothetical protein